MKKKINGKKRRRRTRKRRNLIFVGVLGVGVRSLWVGGKSTGMKKKNRRREWD